MTLRRFGQIGCIMAMILWESLFRAAGVLPVEENVSGFYQSQVNQSQNLCGPYSLSVICKMLGVKADLEEIGRLAGTEVKGTSMKGLADAAHKLGLQARGLRMSLHQLLKLKEPVIVHVRNKHFLVVEKVIGEKLRLIEQDREPYLMPISDFAKIWEGYALIISAPQKPKDNQPDIQIDELVYDWGISEQGKRIRHAFAIKNTGAQMLTINNIIPSCNCSSAKLSSYKILPGHETQLEVEYATTFTDWGVKMISVEIHSNDLDEPVVLVSITGIVVSEIPVLPNRIELGNINGKGKIIRKIEVYDWGLQQLEVKKVSDSSPNIEAKLVSQKRGEKAVIQVEINPEITRGEIKEEVVIYTNHPQTPKISIQIRGNVAGPITVSPSHYFLGFIKRGQPTSSSITLINRGTTDLKITQVECQAKEISIEIVPQKKGQEYLVKISFLADKETPATLKDIIRIHTNNPEQSLIEVPVYGIVQ